MRPAGEYYILLFFAMSVLGWSIEVVGKYIEVRRFINSGFLIGPYCPIYGVGSVLIILLLEWYADSPLAVFGLAMLICGTLEYMTSYAMEKLFNARWWDYSHRRFNIDGRVCARTLIPFGLLGLLLMYLIKPMLFAMFEGVLQAVLDGVCISLCLLFAADVVVSATVLSRIRKSANTTGGDDTETLTKAVRDTLSRQSALMRRPPSCFPGRTNLQQQASGTSLQEETCDQDGSQTVQAKAA